MYIYVDQNFQVGGDIGVLRFKRGDVLSLSLIFIGNKGKPVRPNVTSVILGGKVPGDYSGDFVIYCDEFDLDTTPKGQTCLTGSLRLNTEALADLIGDEEYTDLSAELEFNSPDWKVTSQTLRFRIDNDLIKNTEGIPSGTVPEYVTKSYVNNLFQEKEEYFEELAEQSENAAASAEESARKSLESFEKTKAFEDTTRLYCEETRILRDETKGYRDEALSANNTLQQSLPIIENAVATVQEKTKEVSENAAEVKKLTSESSVHAESAAASKAAAEQAAETAETAARQASDDAEAAHGSATEAAGYAKRAQEAQEETESLHGEMEAACAYVGESLSIIEDDRKRASQAASEALDSASAASQSAENAASSSDAAHEARQLAEAASESSQGSAAQSAQDSSTAASHASNAQAASDAAAEAAEAADEARVAAEDAAQRAAAIANVEDLYDEIDIKISRHNEDEESHSELFATKLDISTAQSDYATKEEVLNLVWNGGSVENPTTFMEGADVTFVGADGLSSRIQGNLWESLSGTSRSAINLMGEDEGNTGIFYKSGYGTAHCFYNGPENNLTLSIEAKRITAAQDIVNESMTNLSDKDKRCLIKIEEVELLLNDLPDPSFPIEDAPGKLSFYNSSRNLTAGPFHISAPVGTIVCYAGSTVPDGWLECDGSYLQIKTYADLFQVIQFSYLSNPIRENEEQFPIPDLRGQFIRSWDHGKGVDSGRALGSTQTDAIRNITGGIYWISSNGSPQQPASGALYWGNESSGYNVTQTGAARNGILFNASRVVPTASENRPVNIALMYIIKY